MWSPYREHSLIVTWWISELFGQCNLNLWKQNWGYCSNWKKLMNWNILFELNGEFPCFFKNFPLEIQWHMKNTRRGEQVRRRCSQRGFYDCICLWHIFGYPVFVRGVRKQFTLSWKYFLPDKPWEWGFNGWLRRIFDRMYSYWFLIFLFLLSVYLDFIFLWKKVDKSTRPWSCKILLQTKIADILTAAEMYSVLKNWYMLLLQRKW